MKEEEGGKVERKGVKGRREERKDMRNGEGRAAWREGKVRLGGRLGGKGGRRWEEITKGRRNEAEKEEERGCQVEREEGREWKGWGVLREPIWPERRSSKFRFNSLASCR